MTKTFVRITMRITYEQAFEFLEEGPVLNLIRNYSYVVFLFLIALVSVAMLPGKGEAEPARTAEILVAQGDTLIALHEKADTTLPADLWIEEVLKLNDKNDATILAGETLVVPSQVMYMDDIQLAGDAE